MATLLAACLRTSTVLRTVLYETRIDPLVTTEVHKKRFVWTRMALCTARNRRKNSKNKNHPLLLVSLLVRQFIWKHSFTRGAIIYFFVILQQECIAEKGEVAFS